MSVGLFVDRRQPRLRIGARLKVELLDGEWHPATFLALRASLAGEPFDHRIDLQLTDGRRLLGCHPRHVELA